jgi:pimeloyl-ACP methyl ester carboxylesterase
MPDYRKEFPMWKKQFAKVGRHKVAYVEAGEGAPILLLHGFPTSSYLFHGVLPRLAETRHVFALDLLGYGGSVVPGDQPTHIEAQAEMVTSFAGNFGLSPYTLVGHDLGGGIGQLIGLDSPGTVSRMVWINTVMDDNFPVRRISLLINALGLPGVAGLLKNSLILQWWAASPLGLQSGVHQKEVMDDIALGEFVFEPFLLKKEDMERFLWVIKDQRLSGRITRRIAPRLNQITTPTLVLWGEHDPYFSLDWPERLVREVPGVSEYIVLPEAGHFSPLEQPDLIAEHILAFLSAD